MELTSDWNVRKIDNLLCPPFPWWRTHPLIWGQKETNWLSGSVASCWNFKTFNSWVREMSQCVKAMAAQCGHLSWDPQNAHKKAGMAVRTCNQVPLLWCRQGQEPLLDAHRSDTLEFTFQNKKQLISYLKRSERPERTLKYWPLTSTCVP